MSVNWILKVNSQADSWGFVKCHTLACNGRNNLTRQKLTDYLISTSMQIPKYKIPPPTPTPKNWWIRWLLAPQSRDRSRYSIRTDQGTSFWGPLGFFSNFLMEIRMHSSGCVRPTSMAISKGVCVYLWGWLRVCRGGVSGGVCQERVCMSMGLYTPCSITCWDTHTLPNCMLGYTPCPTACWDTHPHPIACWHTPPPPSPWIEWMTHACENITFPQILLRAVTRQSMLYYLTQDSTLYTRFGIFSQKRHFWLTSMLKKIG